MSSKINRSSLSLSLFAYFFSTGPQTKQGWKNARLLMDGTLGEDREAGMIGEVPNYQIKSTMKHCSGSAKMDFLKQQESRRQRES